MAQRLVTRMKSIWDETNGFRRSLLQRERNHDELMRLLLSAIITVLASFAVAAAEVDVTHVQTKLVSEGTLSPDELRMVIQLAADCGVTNVASVTAGVDRPQ